MNKNTLYLLTNDHEEYILTNKDNNNGTYSRRVWQYLLFALLFCCLFICSLRIWAAETAPLTLTKLDLKTEREKVYMVLGFNRPPSGKEFKIFKTENPPSVILDLAGVVNGLGETNKALKLGLVNDLDVVYAQGRTRVLIMLKENAQTRVTLSGNMAVVALHPTTPLRSRPESINSPKPPELTKNFATQHLVSDHSASRPHSTSAPSIVAVSTTPAPTHVSALAPVSTVYAPEHSSPLTSSKSKEVSTAAPSSQPTINRVTNVQFSKNADGGALLSLTVTDPTAGIHVSRSGQILSIKLSNAEIAKFLLHTQDVSAQNTPVQQVQTSKVGQNVIIALTVKGDYGHLAYQSHNRFVVEINPKSTTQILHATQRFDPAKFHGKRITLNFQNIKVRSILQVLAEYTGTNIVVSDTVKGDITLRLRDVPWDEALAIILRTRGLDYRQFGGILMIAPREEIAEREKKELEANKEIEQLAPLQSELIRLKFAKAEQLAGLLKDDKNNLLSKRGQVSVDVRTNTIWVQDVNEQLREVRRLVGELDIPVRQVVIEARIVNVDENFERQLGVRFGITRARVPLSGTLRGANQLQQAADNLPQNVAIADRLNFDVPSGAFGQAQSPGSIGIALAKLGRDYLLDLELSALESEGGARIVSTPRLITADQQVAHIRVGEEIPYQIATSSGATAVEFREAALSLEVTPQITPDHRVILTLQVNQDKRGQDTPEGPAIDKREVRTQVLVNNGQTIVLGGLYERNNREQVTRIPFLGSLPIVGALFRHKQKLDIRTELLIFVTPKIVTDSLAMNQMGQLQSSVNVHIEK